MSLLDYDLICIFRTASAIRNRWRERGLDLPSLFHRESAENSAKMSIVRRLKAAGIDVVIRRRWDHNRCREAHVWVKRP